MSVYGLVAGVWVALLSVVALVRLKEMRKRGASPSGAAANVPAAVRPVSPPLVVASPAERRPSDRPEAQPPRQPSDRPAVAERRPSSDPPPRGRRGGALASTAILPSHMNLPGAMPGVIDTTGVVSPSSMPPPAPPVPLAPLAPMVASPPPGRVIDTDAESPKTRRIGSPDAAVLEGRQRPSRASNGTRPMMSDPTGVLRPSSEPPPARAAETVHPLTVPPGWHAPALPEPGPDLLQLRDQLLPLRTRGCFVVGVTSDADALTSKSMLAGRLALLLAESSARVLLMETNFDFPGVQRVLGVEMPPLTGFSQQIHARIRTGERLPWKVVRCAPKLDVLGEGFMRSPGVALSRELSDAFAELKQHYDFIVADGPAAGAGADCKPMDAFANAVVVAVRGGEVLADAASRAARWFTQKELLVAVSAV